MDLIEAATTAISLASVERLQAEVSKLPQYEPKTRHYFHGGMYCREVWRDGGVLVVGKVHKKEHFYLIVSGRVMVGPDEYGPGSLILSKPGTKRAVLSLEPTTCMTFHRTDATTVEDAEAELVEEDDSAMFTIGNRAKHQGALQ
ncbi:MAG: hypothetical protein WCP82_10175 [Alphaproteobacteria bacterium]